MLLGCDRDVIGMLLGCSVRLLEWYLDSTVFLCGFDVMWMKL